MLRPTIILLCAILTATNATAAPPNWLADPADSRWITFGGSTGIAESNGITALDKTGEGDIRPVVLAGVAGADSSAPTVGRAIAISWPSRGASSRRGWARATRCS